ncbi:MAG: DUF1638 domain-containing protein [Desulfatitalea sp.]|nr:DUF1638 domain-containing protein [Desulfatitalea sp.]
MTSDVNIPLLISCGILREEILALKRQGRIIAHTHFLSSRLHSHPQHLGKALSATMAFYRPKFGQQVVVVYGDACLGFNGEMARLVSDFGMTKVSAVNCIDCLLGGRGRLLEIDPGHRYFFLNRAFLQFGRRLFNKDPAAVREQFKMLSAIVPIDSMGDLNVHWNEVRHVSEVTGLPLKEVLDVGLDGVEKVLAEAVQLESVRCYARLQFDP